MEAGRGRAMNCKDEARQVWERLFPERPWEALERLYEIPPRVTVDTAEVFCMARPVPTFLGADVVRIECAWPLIACDCWFVMLFAGKLDAIWEHVPAYLPYAAWVRPKNQGLYFYSIERIRELSHVKRHVISTSV